MKAHEIARLMPEVYQRTLRSGSPLDALLQLMDSLHRSSEERLTHLDEVFQPYRTPEGFVPFLAYWVDLDRFFADTYKAIDTPESTSSSLSTGGGRLRELIAAAARLSQWRGTHAGLTQFLETATGVKGFELDEAVPGDDGLPQPFHIRIGVPKTALLHKSLIKRIIEQEKPAYVTYEIEYIHSESGAD